MWGQYRQKHTDTLVLGVWSEPKPNGIQVLGEATLNKEYLHGTVVERYYFGLVAVCGCKDLKIDRIYSCKSNPKVCILLFD